MKELKNFIILKMRKTINLNSYRRLVFDELCANFLALSENRKRIKKNKVPKFFKMNIQKKLLKIYHLI